MNELTQDVTPRETSGSRRTLLRRSALLLGAGAAATMARAAHESTASTSSPDINVLNYALTLEHLEAAFYNEFLPKFSASDFNKATYASYLGTGITSSVVSNLQRVRDHENAHVQTITSVIRSLGGTPVGPCNYKFPVNSPDDFIRIAAALENTGVSAYAGAVDKIQSNQLLTAAATIATVEARHAAYLNLLNGAIPFPDAFDTAKTMQEILAIANQFITSCGSQPVGTQTTAILEPRNLTTVQRQIQLDARKSISGTGMPLSYSVRQIGGNPAAISNANSATPLVQFVTPGPYTFELTVTDSAGTVSREAITVIYAGL